MNKLQKITPYQAAIRYINMGLAVFPVVYKSKIPLTENGCKDATTDAAIVKAWWQKYPNANIGIATGMKSGGLFVIDLDIDENKGINGYESLRDWEKEHEELPDSWQAITGRGGYHLFYKSTKNISNRAGILEGVDIRGEGGYIVAPPSVHQNGNKYEWEQDPDEFSLLDANETIYKLLEQEKNKSEHFELPQVVVSGKRNETMFRFACSLQAKGLPDIAIEASVIAVNKKNCQPPLDDKEVQQIISSVLKFEKNKPITLNSHNEVIQIKRLPQLAYDKKGILQTIENMCEAIQYDPELYQKIKYNTLSYSPYIFGSLPWEHEDNYREWNNADDSNLKCYIEAKYGLKNMEKMMEAFNVVVNRNKFNPVIEYLEQIQWDGEHRIENLLSDYLGVEKNEYSITCMKLFMLGAINRAYHAGCKFDYMPVLVGEQGVGKSTFFKLLAGNDNWYNDNFNTVEGDKAAEKLRGMWIVELAELLATKRAKEVESIKAFLTSTIDIYRPPYGRRTEQRPRTCVFAGTTNTFHFLTDRTGNRRYLPLIVNKSRVKKSLFEQQAREDFEQAWGEAMYLFKTENPKLVLPPHLQEYVKNMQGNFVEEDVRVGLIQEWLDNTTKQYVCVAMLYKEALENEYEKPSRRESNELHDIMIHSIRGWQRVENDNGGRRKLPAYGTQICYERVEKETKFEPVQEEVPFD